MKKAFMKKGFSLIEIMVVVAIMGILAAVAVPQVFKMVETSNRKIDAVNAMEMANILKRSFETGTVQFTNSDAKNNLKPEDMTISVVVTSEGVNYYSGSGQVLVNGMTWENDKPTYGKNFGRIEALFDEAGFKDVRMYAHNGDGGWACYGALLLSDGSTKIFSSKTASTCMSGNNHENMVKNVLKQDNPISAYLPPSAR